MPIPAGQTAAFFRPKPNPTRFQQLRTGAMPSIKNLETRPASSSLQFPQRFLCGSSGFLVGVQCPSPMEGFFVFLSRIEAVLCHSEMVKQVSTVRPFLGDPFQKLDGVGVL